jgi:hypothetical protein
MGVAGRDTMRSSPHQCLQTFLEASPLGVALALPKNGMSGFETTRMHVCARALWQDRKKATIHVFYHTHRVDSVQQELEPNSLIARLLAANPHNEYSSVPLESPPFIVRPFGYYPRLLLQDGFMRVSAFA